MSIALTVVLFIVIAVAVLRWVIRQMRTYDWNKHTAQEGAKQEKTSFLRLIGSFWPLIPAVAGGLKYIYKAWEKAPPGSPEKAKWALVLLILAALAFRAAIWLVDKRINSGQAKDYSLEPVPMEIEQIENG